MNKKGNELMAIDDNTGVQMPGSDQEQFAHGQDYRGIQPAPNVGGVGVGNLSAPSQAQQDSMRGLDSNAADLFNDGVHGADGGGMDAMRGLASGQQHEETLVNDSMYGSQEAYPFSFPLPETANPINPAASGAQGDSTQTRE
jgi:hypothetical protein